MQYHPSALQLLAEERGAELMRRAESARQARGGERRGRSHRTPLWVPMAWRTGTWLVALGTRLQAVRQQPACTACANNAALCEPS